MQGQLARCHFELGKYQESKRIYENMLKIEKVKSLYAFEPQKNIFKELKKNFSKNEKITLFNFAMDKEITNKKLKINKLSMTSSLAEINEKRPPPTRHERVRRLRRICAYRLRRNV